MAILFEKELSESDILFAYNNNIVIFREEDVLLTAKKAVITFNGKTFTLYPDPSGRFYFNFKYSAPVFLNSNNFEDNTCFDLAEQAATEFQNEVIADGGTFEAFDCLVAQLEELGIAPIIQWTDNIFKIYDVVYKIFYTNGTEDEFKKDYYFLSAYVNYQNFKQLYPDFPYDAETQKMMLKPIPYLKYWSGYPFDFTWYDGTKSNLEFTINGNLETYTNDTEINRVVISNGSNEFITLNIGYNTINDFQIEKITDHCKGHYIKWLNSFGGWNYWLFYKGNDTLTTKDLGQIFNDYNDVVDTVSPYVSIGKTSENNIAITQDNITPNEMLILNDLLDSPKVYLFTGLPNQKTKCKEWLEVNIKQGTFRVSNSREKMTSLNITIELPANTTKTL
jgi:hypothetical protein